MPDSRSALTRPALAIDAGQTEIRAALVDERGPRVATAPGVLAMDGDRVGPRRIADSLLAAVAALGDLPDGLPAVGVGLSGFETARASDLSAVAAELRRALGVSDVAIASDGVTSLLGALGDRPGAVVAAGTGTIVVARYGDAWARVDGWGAVLGDAGSGFAIGRAGIDAALRAHDGRDGSAALHAAALRVFGELEELPALVRRVPSWSRTIAAFTVEVAGCAAAGDGEATRILRAAGSELALSAAAALERVFPSGEPALVSYTGNVFRAGPLLLEAFAAEVDARRPGTRIVEPAGDSLAGAALLPGVPAQPGLVWSEA